MHVTYTFLNVAGRFERSISSGTFELGGSESNRDAHQLWHTFVDHVSNGKDKKATVAAKRRFCGIGGEFVGKELKREKRI